MYYQSLPNAPTDLREFAIQQGKLRATIEPEILERLTVFTWKFTGEQLWVARIYSSLFWLIGGIFIYLLARDLFSKDSALFTSAFYLLLPYAVIASRSFQPDPLMVALIVGFWWAVNRWSQSLTPNSHPLTLNTQYAVRNTQYLLASLLGGFAIFIKLNAAFFVIGGALGATLGRASIRDLLRNRQVWAMAVLGILPGLGWVIYGLTRGFLGQQFGGRFMPELFLSPNFYLGWAQMLDNVIGLFPFALALLGLLLVDSKPTRSFLLGLWAAYLAFALFFDYHISTHDYYSLPLVPIAALALTPLADAIIGRTLAPHARLPGRAAPGSAGVGNPTYASRNGIPTYAILTLCLFAALWTSRAALKSVDYRPQAAFWDQIGETVRGHRVVALTQEYALPLAYWGWTGAANWPDSSDIEYHALRGGNASFEKSFERLTKNKDLFLVTDLADLKRQPDLQARLSEFAIFAEGEGYIIYDLQTPR
jgi:4-amino-4-deoxy-L-arabinose transferase-like glycosyltransferase